MADTGWKFHATSANGTTGEDWQNRANAANDADSDAVMTKVSGTATESLFYDYTFGVPGDATIDGIEVEARGRDTFGDAGWVLELYASWDGGTSWTAVKRFPASGDFPPASGTAFQVRGVGGATDTWGRTWSASDFSNGNFRLRINYLSTGDGGASEVAIDYFKVKVYYTEGSTGFNADAVSPIGLNATLGIQASIAINVVAQVSAVSPIALQGTLGISGSVDVLVKNWRIPTNAAPSTSVHVTILNGSGQTYAIVTQGRTTVNADGHIYFPAQGTIGQKSLAYVHNYDDNTETSSIYGGPCIATIVDVG